VCQSAPSPTDFHLCDLKIRTQGVSPRQSPVLRVQARVPGSLHLIDAGKAAAYYWTRKTTVDIDEGVLRAAEAQALQQGKPLAALVEEALRRTVNTATGIRAASPPSEADPGLEDNDPFFAALDEIRNAGTGAKFLSKNASM
jgi:hypothetical protein